MRTRFLLALAVSALLAACAQTKPSEPAQPHQDGLIDKTCPPSMATKGLC
jgi:outer membrane biogenesis lipoprotein LolB